MLAMLKFPFARVDGIELSKEISDIAIRKVTNLKKERWQVFNGDATTYKDYNAYSMLYLYDPFPEEIIRQVVDNIHSSISDSEQRCWLSTIIRSATSLSSKMACSANKGNI